MSCWCKHHFLSILHIFKRNEYGWLLFVTFWTFVCWSTRYAMHIDGVVGTVVSWCTQRAVFIADAPIGGAHPPPCAGLGGGSGLFTEVTHGAGVVGVVGHSCQTKINSNMVISGMPSKEAQVCTCIILYTRYIKYPQAKIILMPERLIDLFMWRNLIYMRNQALLFPHINSLL